MKHNDVIMSLTAISCFTFACINPRRHDDESTVQYLMSGRNILQKNVTFQDKKGIF